jgi:hypothetical protein
MFLSIFAFRKCSLSYANIQFGLCHQRRIMPTYSIEILFAHSLSPNKEWRRRKMVTLCVCDNHSYVVRYLCACLLICVKCKNIIVVHAIWVMSQYITFECLCYLMDIVLSRRIYLINEIIQYFNFIFIFIPNNVEVGEASTAKSSPFSHSCYYCQIM